MEEIVKRRKIIDIDLAPNVDEVYTGRCLVANAEIVMLLNFNEENGEFDGFTIVKNKDVEQYRVWEEVEYATIKNDNSESAIAKIELDDFSDMENALKCLVSELVAIFTYDDDDSFFVGRVIQASKDSVELQLMDEDSNWSETAVIQLNDISYLGFDTEYERALKMKIALTEQSTDKPDHNETEPGIVAPY